MTTDMAVETITGEPPAPPPVDVRIETQDQRVLTQRYAPSAETPYHYVPGPLAEDISNQTDTLDDETVRVTFTIPPADGGTGPARAHVVIDGDTWRAMEDTR